MKVEKTETVNRCKNHKIASTEIITPSFCEVLSSEVLKIQSNSKSNFYLRKRGTLFMRKYMDTISNSTTDPKPTVYISGAITGVDAVIVRAEFSIAEEEAKKLFPNHSIFNPYKVGTALPGEWTYEQIMNLDLAVLEDCDAIYMMDGWQASRGATIEHKFAKENGIEIVYQKDFTKELEKRNDFSHANEYPTSKDVKGFDR